jgi:modulator of drug activity B
MKTKIFLIAFITLLTVGLQSKAQTVASKENNKTKTVLLINAHLTYPGWSEGRLNKSFFDVAKDFFIAHSYRVLETKIEDGYNPDEEVEKHLEADIVIL